MNTVLVVGTINHLIFALVGAAVRCLLTDFGLGCDSDSRAVYGVLYIFLGFPIQLLLEFTILVLIGMMFCFGTWKGVGILPSFLFCGSLVLAFFAW